LPWEWEHVSACVKIPNRPYQTLEEEEISNKIQIGCLVLANVDGTGTEAHRERCLLWTAACATLCTPLCPGV
jgi:hypothetical protein